MGTDFVQKEISVGMSFGNYNLLNENYNCKYKKQTKDEHINSSSSSRTEEYYDESGKKIAFGRKNKFYDNRKKQTNYGCVFQTEHLYYSGLTSNLNKAGVFTKIESDNKWAVDLNGNNIVDENEIFNK